MRLFEVNDKTGRMIYLTQERWKHILREHPSLGNCLEFIKQTLIKPLTIKQSTSDSYVYLYYQHRNTFPKRYLLVVVKYLNGEGFIITSFYTNKIKD